MQRVSPIPSCQAGSTEPLKILVLVKLDHRLSETLRQAVTTLCHQGHLKQLDVFLPLAILRATELANTMQGLFKTSPDLSLLSISTRNSVQAYFKS